MVKSVIHHLFRTTRADVVSLPPRETLVDAASRVTDLVFDDFKSQVVPFIEPDHLDLCGTRDAWNAMQGLVLEKLLELESLLEART